jgi:hypothetical protein
MYQGNNFNGLQVHNNIKSKLSQGIRNNLFLSTISRKVYLRLSLRRLAAGEDIALIYDYNIPNHLRPFGLTAREQLTAAIIQN